MLSKTHLQLGVFYDAPVVDCRRVLYVLPLQRSNQKVLSETWRTMPEIDSKIEKQDDFRNRRLSLYHRRIDEEFRFEMEIEVETTGEPILDFTPDYALWKMPSRSVVFAPELQSLARDVRSAPALERASQFCKACFESLKYEAQTNSHPGPASQIWAFKKGNCTDFTHVFLSLCRASGLPARYVAGFNRAEGQMHAWAEVWADNHWHSFDPTLGRESSQGSVAVAVGRDFYDCAPHTGSFRGTGEARLSLFCRTRVEK